MKPILFSKPMVQAILEDRKTMTRRIDKEGKNASKYQVGDILWVRETTCYVMLDHAHDLLEGAKHRTQFVYKASVHSDWMEYAKQKYGYKWKPSIFMPKEAARIFLRITDVRSEKLQDISEADAIAEGILEVQGEFLPKGWKDYLADPEVPFDNPKNSFASLWKSIHGKDSWNDNPYVRVISFVKINKP